MWKDLGASWAILLGIGFMMLANGLQGTLLGVRAGIEGFTTFTTGIMMSGYFIGMFVGSLAVPVLISRVGHIRVFSALASLASISILFHGIYIDPWLWMAMRVITGVCFAGFYVVTESWLNDRASNETRGKVLSIYMVIVTGGMGLGQFLLNAAEPEQIDLFILISVIISFGLIPILLTVKPAPSFDTSTKMSLIELYRASPLALIGNCLTGMAHGTIFGLGAIYASAVLVDLAAIAWFMACFLIGSLISQWPVGYVSDLIGRRAIMAALSIVSIVCCLLALAIPTDSILFYLVIVGLGGAAMPMYSICIAYANDRLEPQQIVAASGSLVMVAGFGAMTGPIVIAFFMDLFDVWFYFWGIATVFAIIFFFTLIRIGARAGVALEDQSALVAGPIGTPIAEYIAPDSVEYAEAVAKHEVEQLDLREDITERQL
ncbi:MAG: MFS transporter [Gammaproteobacteria bacterium]|nr:MAG: MFS transporter [Gammaproteobacteria bacterium]UCH39089.1 MAG: MFS transporter [Gammaproteobacteria bacterium]